MATLRARIAYVFAGLIAFNLAVWAWSLWAFHDRPVLLGAAVLAYTLGLRHAVDADHIAAIDNVTRKLMQRGERPIGVGLFFSLGHSTVVVLAFVALALATNDTGLMRFKGTASLLGVGVSATFLFVIAIVNGMSLVAIWRSRRHVKDGAGHGEEDLDRHLAGKGILSRLLRPAFSLVGRSRHMYPLGVLFGLGFDTATEIAMLGLSATGAAQGVSLWSLLALPALFTAGMTLVDTADSILMLGAYGWAFVDPIRKVYYNLTVTLISVVVAVIIGSIEVLTLAGHAFGLAGGPWRLIGALNDGLGSFGYAILAAFAVCWIGSGLAYRLLGHGRAQS